MVSADDAIIVNPTIFGWDWLWEIEKVFLSMQLRADQQRFVQSLCRSSFINFFPASITNLDKKRTKHKYWSSSFLNHFISSPWPVNSLVPLDFTVNPYFFETITGRDNQRTTFINPDVTSPIQFLFNKINQCNPHAASHVDQRLSQLLAMYLSHNHRSAVPIRREFIQQFYRHVCFVYNPKLLRNCSRLAKQTLKTT
ncbi:hypothetical protein BLNAU_24421 [Blattamonas nauphoetae]|uniref:Uncharacterized protein n=1 Tax=Blattamonas nauphoetae TaxID=2049346 RepID=A0ABQ9WNE2_9EUKA|nr:hypothetical protein BLNAU_24421 [Blattamonas nauphoetae]